MKFRVIDGVAIIRNPEAGPAVPPEFTKDEDGKPVELTFRAGQICESKTDLRRNHVNKFERVHDDYVEQPAVVE